MATIPAATFEHELVQGSAANAKKASGATAAVGTLNVNPAQLRTIPGFNVRIDTADYLAHIESLKASIKANGFYPEKALAGYVGKEGEESVFFVTDGHSRLRAVNELVAEGVEIASVPFVPRANGQNMEDLTVALLQANEGRPLSVFEKSIVVKRLSGYGLNNVKIGERLGMTDRYVGDLLILQGASAKVRNLVIKGTLSATEAVKQLRKGKGDGALVAAADAAAAKGKGKVTGKDVKAAAEPKDKKSGATMSAKAVKGKVIQTLRFNYKAGAIVEIDEIKSVRFLGGADWWNFVDENTKTHAVIEEDIEIVVTLTTKDTAAPAAPATAETVEDASQIAQEGGEGGDGDDLTDEQREAALAQMDAVTTEAVAPGEPEAGETAEEDEL